MTFKTFTFTYDFADIDTAQVASTAIMGYMIGTYHAPVVETTVQNGNQLLVEYAADKKLSKTFKRICDSFKDYYNTPDAEHDTEEQYKLKRVKDLSQSETFDSLLEKVAAYELELMDYADRLLDADGIPMDFMTAEGTLDLLGKKAIETLKSVDVDGDYKALWQ